MADHQSGGPIPFTGHDGYSRDAAIQQSVSRFLDSCANFCDTVAVVAKTERDTPVVSAPDQPGSGIRLAQSFPPSGGVQVQDYFLGMDNIQCTVERREHSRRL